MNDQTNVEVIQRLHDAFVRRDMKAIVDLQADDTEWSAAGPVDRIPWAEPRRGREGVADFLKVRGDALQVESFAATEFFAQADKVVVLGHQKGTAIASGKPFDMEFVQVWTLSEGKITKLRSYFDTAHIIDALGAD